MKKQTFIALIFLWLAIGCNGDVMPPLAVINQLENDEAIMPVHIYGNQEAKTAIIIVHGGPGESAILKREATGFYQLEEEHLVVYYDQRGSGISEGNVDETSLSVAQMSEDLHVVIQLVVAGTDVEHIFLISLDWGAAIAVDYLTSAVKSPKIKGYFAVSPGFDAPLTMQRSRQELIDFATELLADGNAVNDDPAQNLIDFYAGNPVINRFNYQEHYQLVEALGGIIINIEHDVSGVEQPAFVQSLVDHNLQFMLENWTFEGEHFLENLDVTDQLSAIDVPVKFIWGFWDRLMPISLAEDYQNLLGSASEEELISVFPASANRPYLEEGNRFFATVATWVTFYD